MAKGHFQFRPKDGTLLNWIRQQAAKEKRSVNNWMEIHFTRLKSWDENPKDVTEIIHRLNYNANTHPDGSVTIGAMKDAMNEPPPTMK